MKLPSLITILFVASSILPASAVDKIDEFLGLKFGASPTVAKTAMLARGSKLKDEKTPDMLRFTEGTYAGQQINELDLQFSGDHFAVATVTLKFETDKSDEKGLALYDSIRKSLTDKYGPPTTAPSTARGKNFIEKAKASELETTWLFKDALKGDHRSITLRVPGIGMYSWTFKVIYQDHKAGGASKGTPPRKDI